MGALVRPASSQMTPLSTVTPLPSSHSVAGRDPMQTFHAHQHDYQGYVNALRQYDRWLNELVDKLNTMGDYGRKTAVIVTTDHGRGSGANSWSEHGVGVPESGRIWTYVRLPQTGTFRIIENATNHSHLDIRPTIESLFGLQPLACSSCGTSFIINAKRD